MTALLTVRQNDGTIDHSKIETHLELALTALSELDDIARLAGQAQNTLQTLKTNGAQTQKKIREALITSLAVLHP
jgi:hypothetical protein